jgi:hypothetical protein
MGVSIRRGPRADQHQHPSVLWPSRECTRADKEEVREAFRNFRNDRIRYDCSRAGY